MSSRHRGLRLIAGPPGAGPGGIEEAFLAEARRLQSGDPLRPIIVLTGSNYLRLRLRRLLAVRSRGHANIRFMLLKDLARDLGGPALLERGRRRLPEAGRDLLLKSVVSGGAHGTYFDRIALTRGFLDALGATLDDLKEAGVEPALVRAAGAGLRASGRRAAESISGRKLEDLAALYETYDDFLQDRRLYDDQDLMRSATTRAPVAEREPPAVILYGFYDFNWQQRALLQSFLAFRQGVVFVPFEADREDAYAFAQPALEWLRSWITERIDLPPRPGNRPGGLPRDVTVLSAPGEGREVMEAARWLIGLARERSLPFGSMGLLYRSSEPYRQVVAEVMEDAGPVPHFLVDGLPLSRGAAARALLLLMEARRDGMSRRTITALLSLTDASGQASLWERLSREAGVVRGLADWRTRLTRLESERRRRARQGDGALEREARAARDLLASVESLASALQAIPTQGRWSDLAAAAIELLHRFAPAGGSSEPVERALEALGALDEIESPVQLDEFIQRAREALDRGSARRGEFERSGIFVGGVMDARLLGFDAVAVVGLAERVFPVPPREDPILLDDEREAINRLIGEPRLSLKRRRLDEERLLFRLAVSSATESLRLSYPRLDPAGARPRSASPFLLKAASHIAGRPVDEASLETFSWFERIGLAALGPSRPGAAILGREFDLCILRREVPAAEADSAAGRRVRSFLQSNPLLQRALDAEQARWGETRFTAHDGVIQQPHVLEFLRALHPLRGEPLSASRIERYATCPLKYFFSDVLGLSAIEDPEDAGSIHPLRRGSLVHAVLHDLFAALRERGLLPLSASGVPAALALAREIAASAFAAEEEAGVAGPRMIWEIDKEKILEDLAAVVAAEAAQASPFIPSYFEMRFGMKPHGPEPEDAVSTEDPVPFEIGPDRGVLLKGRIDRIDLSADRRSLRITDYKTGKMGAYEDDALRGGTRVQLPLYMVAAERVLGTRHPGVRAAEARYLSVDQAGGFRAVGFTAAALAGRSADLAQAVSTFVNGVERGAFFASPRQEICSWCDFKAACGEGREARFERKKKDATAADYLRMKETP